jgi:hypothetical protein
MNVRSYKDCDAAASLFVVAEQEVAIDFRPIESGATATDHSADI